MAGGIDFNRGKFKELVLFFVYEAHRAGDEGFGMVKLNKLLYRADFEAYRLLGRSITGEIYEKQEFGPVAQDLPIVLDDLGRAGRLRWDLIARGPHTRKVPRPTADPEAAPYTGDFVEDEFDVLTKTLRELATFGGRDASEWSHDQSVGWKVVPEYGQVIDYGTAFISPDPIPPEDLERAREFVRERGWVKSAAD